MTEDNLFIEDIDWTLIDPEKFEKLIYFLLDSIGMKNIIWRKGGPGVSATDGGRDLECEDNIIERDGSVRTEKWWIEVKYRTNTLEKRKVQETLMNAFVSPDVDVICIATNNVITNPTQDWIDKFKEQKKAKKIVIWQGHNLENIIKNNPSFIYRFFPSSLTLKGRFNVINTRFLSYLQLPSGTDLIDLWENKQNLKFSPKTVLPIILAEATFGDLVERQWGLWFEKDLLFETFIIGLLNITYLLHKCEALGKDSLFIMGGMEYLLLTNLLNFKAAEITESIDINILHYLFKNNHEESKNSYGLIQITLEPIIFNICFKFLEVCDQNYLCKKLSLGSDIKNDYIKKFIPNEINENRPFLIIQDLKENCKFDLEIPKNNCPLMYITDIHKITDKNSLLKVLEILQKVFTELRDRIIRLS